MNLQTNGSFKGQNPLAPYKHLIPNVFVARFSKKKHQTYIASYCPHPKFITSYGPETNLKTLKDLIITIELRSPGWTSERDGWIVSPIFKSLVGSYVI